MDYTTHMHPHTLTDKVLSHTFSSPMFLLPLTGIYVSMHAHKSTQTNTWQFIDTAGGLMRVQRASRSNGTPLDMTEDMSPSA